jgi:hypothetical protein
MRKLNFIFILVFGLFSCEKESILPPEYEYLLGDWILDNYEVTYNPDITTPISDSFPADSFGKELSIRIRNCSIQYFIEGTLTQNVSNFTEIQVNTGTYGGETSIFYYIQYRDELYVKRSTSLSYIPANDIICLYYHLYDSETGSYYGASYEFNYKRN